MLRLEIKDEIKNSLPVIKVSQIKIALENYAKSRTFTFLKSWNLGWSEGATMMQNFFNGLPQNTQDRALSEEELLRFMTVLNVIKEPHFQPLEGLFGNWWAILKLYSESLNKDINDIKMIMQVPMHAKQLAIGFCKINGYGKEKQHLKKLLFSAPHIAELLGKLLPICHATLALPVYEFIIEKLANSNVSFEKALSFISFINQLKNRDFPDEDIIELLQKMDLDQVSALIKTTSSFFESYKNKYLRTLILENPTLSLRICEIFDLLIWPEDSELKCIATIIHYSEKDYESTLIELGKVLSHTLINNAYFLKNYDPKTWDLAAFNHAINKISGMIPNRTFEKHFLDPLLTDVLIKCGTDFEKNADILLDLIHREIINSNNYSAFCNLILTADNPISLLYSDPLLLNISIAAHNLDSAIDRFNAQNDSISSEKKSDTDLKITFRNFLFKLPAKETKESNNESEAEFKFR